MNLQTHVQHYRGSWVKQLETMATARKVEGFRVNVEGFRLRLLHLVDRLQDVRRLLDHAGRRRWPPPLMWKDSGYACCTWLTSSRTCAGCSITPAGNDGHRL